MNWPHVSKDINSYSFSRTRDLILSINSQTSLTYVGHLTLFYNRIGLSLHLNEITQTILENYGWQVLVCWLIETPILVLLYQHVGRGSKAMGTKQHN